MTEKAISPLGQRLIEDMTIRRLGPKTQHDYMRHVKSFADFLSRSPDKATAEDVQRQDACRPLLLRTLFSLQVTAKVV
jgi:integrase/recombinase XerD